MKDFKLPIGFYLPMSFFFSFINVSCGNRETIKLPSMAITETSIGNEPELKEKINSLIKNNSGRVSSNGFKESTKVIKISIPEKKITRYSLFFSETGKLNQFNNLVLTETNSVLVGYLLTYVSDQKINDIKNFAGVITGYDLKSNKVSECQIRNGKTISTLSSKSGRVADGLPSFPEQSGCYELMLSQTTNTYFWAPISCSGSSGGGTGSGGASSGLDPGGSYSGGYPGSGLSGGGSSSGSSGGSSSFGFENIPIGVNLKWPGSEEGYPYGWWEDDAWLDANFTIDPYGGARLNEAEKALVRLYPVEALLIKRNGEIAESETKARFGINGLNDKSDAFRHAFFNAMNQRDCGKDPNTLESIAKKFSDAHEVSTPSYLQKEKEMDLFNNNVGHQVGDVMFPLLTTNQNLSDQVSQKLVDGELRYLSPIDYSDSCFSGCAAYPVGTHGVTSATSLTPTNR